MYSKHFLCFPSYLFLQYERLENIPELGIMVDPGDEETEREDKVCPQITGSDLTEPGHFLLSPERFQYQKQVKYHRK